ncbi:acyltransferase [Tardiphaga sp.]|uniref:acyltransferase family protein n=1 Tax=Tardiphaga sp. TaxID=1926292 RepID=UPI002635541C|nr:acyltransferase [Tardiphaga sp.]MDB5620006.1 Peptidoglycan/LPS O-acetylase OafA/YrhL, contains acyltransferase and SGNH-hydrolase domain [Tardiphaga sp.]
MAADIRALTGVRGVAAVIIVVYHFGDVQLSTGGTASYFRIPFGYLIVDLFFMLSGFVMALTYRDAFEDLTLSKFATFMLKRVARLYPAYFVIGLFYIAKIAAGLSGENLEMYSAWDWMGNLLMMTGWGLYIFPVIGVAWAASAEMGSYLLLPILMAFTLRKSTPTCAIAVLAALLAIYAVSISGRGSSGPLDVVNGNSFYPLLRAVAGFALGLAIFRFAGVIDRLSMAMQDALVIGILIAIVAIGSFSVSDLPMYLLFIPLVAVLSRDGRIAQALFGNALVYRLGIISYSIYLIHPLFVSFAVRTWRHFGETELVYIAAAFICFAIIWGLSELSYRFVEMPGRKAIVGWFGPDRTRAAG